MPSAVSASQASEIVTALLSLFVVPLAFIALHRIRFPGRTWMTVGLVTMLFVQVFSIVERYSMENAVLPVKQFIVAFAGIAFAIGVWQLALSLRRGDLQ